MNKQGTDKVLSVYWFAILFIVAAGVVYMAVTYYGAPYEVREIEAGILINQIADCISSGGKLNENWGDLTYDNLLEKCSLNFNVEDEYGWKNDQIYASVEEGVLNSENFVMKSQAGDSLLKQNCEDEAGTTFAFCRTRQFYTLDKDSVGNALDKDSVGKVIKIQAIIRKTEKNIQ